MRCVIFAEILILRELPEKEFQLLINNFVYQISSMIV